MLKSTLIIAVLRFLSWLPLRWQRRLGAALGWLLWVLGSDMARITERNLVLCLPELSPEARQRLAKHSVMETCKTIAEAGAVWLWSGERLAQRIQVRDDHLLREALAAGRGVIIVGPHLGNWEVLGFWLSICGLGESVQLYQAPSDPAMAALILKARSRGGATMVPTDARGVSQLLKALRSGAMAGILPDQVPPPSGGEFAPFFGHPALTMTLLSRFVQKTGCAAVLGYVRRSEAMPHGREGFEIVFRPMDEALFSQDLQTSLCGLNHSIEQAVRAELPLYQWEYKRFKRQPDGRRLYDRKAKE